MSQPQLTLVAAADHSPGARAIQLMREAKLAGEEQVASLQATLELMVRQSREIIDGGDAYPAGVRDICAKLVAETGYRSQTIGSIMRTRSGYTPSLALAELDADRPRGHGDEDLDAAPFPFNPAS